jgi:hypothetical protein
MQTCESCRYWLKDKMFPKCRRYPATENHKAEDWCGEYREIIQEPIAAPVIPTLQPMSPELQLSILGIEDADLQAEADRLRKENESLKKSRTRQGAKK